MRRVFFSLEKIKQRTIYMTPIFSVVGKEGGEEGKKKGGKEERERRGGGGGEKKGFLFGERGGRRLKTVMDIEVGEGDGEKRGDRGGERDLIGEEVGGKIKKK